MHPIEISKTLYDTYLQEWLEDKCNDKLRWLYYFITEDKTYVAIDNTTYDFWVEEFKTLEECLEYLDWY